MNNILHPVNSLCNLFFVLSASKEMFIKEFILINQYVLLQGADVVYFSPDRKNIPFRSVKWR